MEKYSKNDWLLYSEYFLAVYSAMLMLRKKAFILS